MKRSSSTIPFGYKLSKDNINLEEVPAELEALETIAPMIRDKTLSLREGSIYLQYKTGRKISHEGLRKRVRGKDT